MICHGQGDPRTDLFDGGCCYVNGAVCTNRWFIDYSTSSPAGDVGTATIYNSNRVSLGTVTAYVTALMPGGGQNKAARVARVVDQIRGVLYVCSAAASALGVDPSLINDRAAFEAAWEARPEYAPVADAWVAIGKPRNWCMTYGPTEGQCCHGETAATNTAKRGKLAADAVSVRVRASGAS